MHRRIRKHGIQFQLTDMSFDEYNAKTTTNHFLKCQWCLLSRYIYGICFL